VVDHIVFATTLSSRPSHWRTRWGGKNENKNGKFFRVITWYCIRFLILLSTKTAVAVIKRFSAAAPPKFLAEKFQNQVKFSTELLAPNLGKSRDRGIRAPRRTNPRSRLGLINNNNAAGIRRLATAPTRCWHRFWRARIITAAIIVVFFFFFFLPFIYTIHWARTYTSRHRRWYRTDAVMFCCFVRTIFRVDFLSSSYMLHDLRASVTRSNRRSSYLYLR
jgi:hypothetical protein